MNFNKHSVMLLMGRKSAGTSLPGLALLRSPRGPFVFGTTLRFRLLRGLNPAGLELGGKPKWASWRAVSARS